MSTQTDMNLIEIEELVILQNKVLNLENEEAKFRLSKITDDDSKVTLYTGYPSF